MATIFINYRRSDSRGTTFALRERLLKYFKNNELFLDIEGLGGGEDFVNALANTVSLADVMVVMIGQDWLKARNADGNLRLHQDDDFVRIEIASAIAQDKKILPVLLEGAQMPAAEDLPDDLKDLARRNAMELRLNRIDDDARVIAQALKKLVPAQSVTLRKLTATAATTGVIALVVGTLAGPFVNTMSGVNWGPDPYKAALQEVESRLDIALEDLGQARTETEAAEVQVQEARAEIQRKIDAAKADAQAAAAKLSDTEAAAHTALEQSRTELKATREETATLRAQFTEQRDLLDDLRTDLKEAQVERRLFLDKYRETNGDYVELKREYDKLDEQIKDQRLRIGYLENRTENLCENYQAFMEADEDGIDRSFLGNLLRVHCRHVQPE